MRLVKVNGELGFVLSSPAEPFPTIVNLTFKEGRVQQVYLIRNPKELRHLKLEPPVKL